MKEEGRVWCTGIFLSAPWSFPLACGYFQRSLRVQQTIFFFCLLSSDLLQYHKLLMTVLTKKELRFRREENLKIKQAFPNAVRRGMVTAGTPDKCFRESKREKQHVIIDIIP